jgi:hypothetical protein
MKKLLLTCLAAGSVLLGVAGCSSGNTVAPIEGSQYLKYGKGDMMTYEVYDRDAANARVDASKSIRVWTVLDTGITYQNKSGVARIEEINYQADGTTETSRDTIYVLSGEDGKVYQYNLLGSMVARISVAKDFADSVPKSWVWIGDIKDTGPLSWLSAGTVQFNMTVQTITAKATVSMNASHVGKKSVTVNDSTFANAFHTDHTLLVSATPVSGGTTQLLNDSLAIHYDIDITAGIVKQTMDSKSVSVTAPGVPIPIPVPVTGFEMNLKSYTKAK